MTHKDGPNPDHIDIEYDPRCGEVNPQVWALQPYYSIFTIEIVSKNDFFST